MGKINHVNKSTPKGFVYTDLGCFDFFFFRIGGPGLANCLFIVSRAFLLAKHNNLVLINPTWLKLSIGPYLRKEKDKRHYYGLFKSYGVNGFRKFYLIFKKKVSEEDLPKIQSLNFVINVSGLKNYFQDFNNHHFELAQFFSQISSNKIKKKISMTCFHRCIAVHIRLGDYKNVPNLMVEINWFRDIILNIKEKLNTNYNFLIFSDGTEDELKPLTSIKDVKKVYFGSALADILAISKCNLVIASDSTFSAWGAFLGYKPIVFCKRHFPPVFNNSEMEIVLGSNTIIPDKFLKYL